MTTSSASSVIGPVEHRILRAADRAPGRVWRVDDGEAIGLTPSSLHQALARLVAAGQLERIERGKYAVMPRSGRVPIRPLDLVGSWFNREPYAVVGHAAAEHHRLTLDTATTVEVLLARSKQPVVFAGVDYVFSRRDVASVTADNMASAKGGASTLVASPAKLLVLLLGASQTRRGSRPERGAGLALEVLERGAARGLWSKVNWPLVVRRHGSASAARRLGFLLEQTGQGPRDDLLSLRGQSGYVSLSPLYPAQGPIDARWRVVVNDPVVR